MLEYEWGNPSTIMLSGDENMQDSGQSRQIFDDRSQGGSDFFSNSTHNGDFLHRGTIYSAAQNFGEATHQLVSHNQNHPSGHHFTTTPPHQLSFHNPHGHQEESLNNTSLYDPYAAVHVSQASLLSLEPSGPTGFMLVPKAEPVHVGAGVDYSSAASSSRIGLNLGGRTYFSSSEDDFVNRLYRRSRAVEPGSVNSPRCQAEGCNADLTHAKHYHRRHKVCEFHSKAATVIAAGLTQRFCQQCSRFHLLSEFDNGKRSCRKRLADHNRRRRKSQQANQEHANKSQLDNARNSSSDNLASRSPSDSGAHVSSVTVAVSPPRISLDCFRQRSYQPNTPSSSASASSLFFSNG